MTYKVVDVDWFIQSEEIVERVERLTDTEKVELFGQEVLNMSEDEFTCYVIQKVHNEPETARKLCNLPEEIPIPDEIAKSVIVLKDVSIVRDYLASEFGYFFYSFKMSDELEKLTKVIVCN